MKGKVLSSADREKHSRYLDTGNRVQAHESEQLLTPLCRCILPVSRKDSS